MVIEFPEIITCNSTKCGSETLKIHYNLKCYMNYKPVISVGCSSEGLTDRLLDVVHSDPGKYI